jgi:thioester reductase-like protein
VFSSECFDLAKKEMGGPEEFKNWVMRTVVPVEGDITKEGVGLSAEMRHQIVQDVNIIMNVAASVDFNEFLKDSLKINYFGCLRMLELAKECRSLNVHLHVSTTYVNSNKLGFIKEDIYDRSDDITKVVQRI